MSVTSILLKKSDKPTVPRLSQWLEPDTYPESSVSLQKSMTLMSWNEFPLLDHSEQSSSGEFRH